MSRVLRKKEKETDRWLLVDGLEEKVAYEDSDLEEMSLKDALKC